MTIEMVLRIDSTRRRSYLVNKVASATRCRHGVEYAQVVPQDNAVSEDTHKAA